MLSNVTRLSMSLLLRHLHLSAAFGMSQRYNTLATKCVLLLNLQKTQDYLSLAKKYKEVAR